jgi:PhoH-like ATPase
MLLELLLDPSIAVVWVQGSGGTGKTLLTAAAQIQQTMIQRPQAYQRAYFSRSSEGVGGERLGFLPGDANEKTGHLYDPLGDNLEVLKQITGWGTGKGNALAIFDTSPNQFQRIILAHSRGRSFNNVIWSVDEAQNLTDQQLATVVTRIGEGSKVIIMADTQQIDFKDPRESGFVRVMESYRGVINSAFVELTVSERSLAAAIGGVLNEDRLQDPSRGSRR